ncbi:hypothetical protein LTR36_005361 [Oleoguttula mirabilis]|uniref:Uncharacterized protein n=1 Tax=Oleoguttula mirabilis TaxID=1507867 RepID=A0AAV9JF91_9PEZI|nr:hypothetical protein LTR36_005361 [Oleoguttula mirabilis]
MAENAASHGFIYTSDEEGAIDNATDKEGAIDNTTDLSRQLKDTSATSEIITGTATAHDRYDEHAKQKESDPGRYHGAGAKADAPAGDEQPSLDEAREPKRL